MGDWVIVLQTQVLPLLAACVAGGLIGLDREIHGRWAGLRTHILVSLGTALFVVVGRSQALDHPYEVTRVLQGIAAGIGFIGAGTILKLTEKLEVKGLTTASSIWLAAAAGAAAGLQEYVLTIWGTALAVIVISVLRKLERHFPKKSDASRERRKRSQKSPPTGKAEEAES